MDIDRSYRSQLIAIYKIKMTIAILRKMDSESKIRSLPVGIPDTIYLDLGWILKDAIDTLENVLHDIDPATFNTKENFDERERWAEANLPSTNPHPPSPNN
jgi:hypothetical protein